MSRSTLLAAAMAASAALIALPATAQTTSLKSFDLHQMLTKVAKESSVGTPRAINEDILDQGYTVQGNNLINHLSVRPSHAVQMRQNPETVRAQMARTVCASTGYRQLMARGATLKYDFTEYKTQKPITVQQFRASDCGLNENSATQ